jgi:hypothetical protein
MLRAFSCCDTTPKRYKTKSIPDPLPPVPPLLPLPQLLHAGIRPPWLFRVENFEMKVRV